MNADRPIEPISSVRADVNSTLGDAGLQPELGGKSTRGKGKKKGEDFGKVFKDARKSKETGEEQE